MDLTSLTDAELYTRLVQPAGGETLPRWPGEEVQRSYTGRSGAQLLGLTRAFVARLAADGAFPPGWRGLDYGAGFGRIATAMLTEGGPDQLDLGDAWERALSLLRANGFRNRLIQVSDVLREGELDPDAYDVIYSVSVFTHLAEEPFWNNLSMLRRSLKPGGRLYFTVRHRDFLSNPSLPAPLAAEIAASLEAGTGFGFGASHAGRPTAHIYGDSIIEEDRLLEEGRQLFDELRALPPPPYPFQHLYVATR
jgi:SAM-dependent methyltransferase